MTTFKNAPYFLATETTEKIPHRGSDYNACIDPKIDTITVKLTENRIHCDTTRNVLGYRDLVKMDEPVWTITICNELDHLSQGWNQKK